jgi:parallel beta-helix repeat protein
MSKEAKIMAVLLVLAFVGSVSAKVITVEVEGVVNSVSVGGRFELDGSVNIGSAMTGTFVYDTDAQNIYSPGANSAYPIISLSMNIGNYTFAHNPSASEPALFNIYTVDPAYLVHSEAPYFSGIIYADGEPKTFEDITWNEPYGRVTILDVLYGADHSGELPTFFPNLSLATRKEFHLGFGELWDYPLPPNRGTFRIDGELTSLRVVQVIPGPATTYYVDALNGGDNSDGLSPETAFATIQKAIDSAFDGDTVLVADGTYTGLGNRDIDFLGKAITVRSENGPENCIIDCNATEDDHHRGFYFHSNEDVYSVIDGFTIINGYPSHPRDGGAIYCRESSPTISNCIIKLSTARGGGGILCRGSSPTIKNCTITDNFADSGGGIMCGDSSRPKITNCTITGNSASSSGGGIYCYDSNLTLTNCVISGNSGWAGGGIYSIISSSPMITDCTISGNTAHIGGGIICDFSINAILTNCAISGNSGWAGGGMNNSYSNPTLIHCIFSGNSAELSGGGMDNTRSSPMMKNCIFAGNIADSGGGMNNSYSNPTLTNCTFAENSAFNGNALAFDSWQHQYPSNIQVTNSILADGGNEIWNNDNSTITINYSDVQGGYEGLGNIDADPCFVEPGYWDINDLWVEGDYHLLEGSPCIDAGDPNYAAGPNETDLDGNLRIVDGDNDGNSVVDMGVYEYMPPTPAELVAELLEGVGGLELPSGIENGLEAKLNAALRALEDENENNDIAAINTLGAFINAVEAQRAAW